MGLNCINANHSIYTSGLSLKKLIISNFIDNIKIMDPKGIEVIARVKIKLITAFKMVNIGLISFYLGLKIKQDPENMIIKLF